MFVTVWLGILNLRTGELVSSNAGHEYPAIRRNNGKFELVKDPHGFVLGGRAKMRYPEMRTVLEEGDTIFVYTDGIVEANNPSGEMYGTERMLRTLTAQGDADMPSLIAGLRKDINSFSKDAPQFDDMTMLAFRLEGFSKEA